MQLISVKHCAWFAQIFDLRSASGRPTAAIYLSSKAPSYVAGVVIPVDGEIIGASGTV